MASEEPSRKRRGRDTIVTRAHTRDARSRFFLDIVTDDVLVNILARVPRRNHCDIAAVCRRWRELVTSERFVALRRDEGLVEPWLYIFGSWLSRKDGMRGVIFDPEDSSTCEMKGWSFRITVSDFACATIGTMIYIIGGVRFSGKGFSSISVCKDVLVYNSRTASWHTASPMGFARAGAACAVVGPKIFVFGGFGSMWEGLNTCEVYDSRINKWESIARLPFRANLYNAQVVDGRILMLDSQVNQGTRDIYAYIPASDAWQLLTRLPFPLPGFPYTLPLHGRFALIGGSSYWFMCSHKALVWDEKITGWRVWSGEAPSCISSCPILPDCGVVQEYWNCTHADCKYLSGVYPFMIADDLFRVRRVGERYGVEAFNLDRQGVRGGPWQNLATVDIRTGRPRVAVVEA
eukprot:TRINITY_DN2797_c0_g1_i1.p1 TRINITY_DN2797_c0_g1~~TRINITY_DN2797_c0_g1_i1.p1  ORF type:complete len:405 (+),score=44.67 TRINITY_DN2797_c0_g1_i1:305-1519(+)